MRVLFLDTVHPLVSEKLTENGHDCLHLEQASIEEINLLLPSVHGLVIRSRYTMDADFLDAAKELKFIARSGVGMENIDEDYCRQRGIAAFNAAGGNATAVGEHVIGMLLTLFNKLHSAHQEVRSGMWRREANRGLELGSRTVGIIGFGHTGQSLARKLSGFDCSIMAYDKYAPVEMNGVKSATLKEIQSDCDVVSFHVPLTEETHHYFDEAFVNAMARPFHLVNASRGPVASTAAMVQGLKEKKILGICLDVLEQEGKDFDLSQNIDLGLQRLMESTKVLFSPHVAGWTTESLETLGTVLLDRILAIEG